LFEDPRFYRDEVVGTRVAGPVEYLVGCARRLQLELPGQMLLNAGDVLGQRLFWPPSVKGWEGGMAWITTATMMQRSNMVGVMLGLVDVRSLMHDEEFEPGMSAANADAAAKKAADKEPTSRTNGFNHLRYIQRMGWKPELALAARASAPRANGARANAARASTDASIVAWML